MATMAKLQITFEHISHDLERFQKKIRKAIVKSGAQCKILVAKNELKTCVVILEIDSIFEDKKAIKSGFQKLFPKILVVDACNIHQGLPRLNTTKMPMICNFIYTPANLARQKSHATTALESNERKRKQYDDLPEDVKELHREQCRGYRQKQIDAKLLLRREQDNSQFTRLCYSVTQRHLLLSTPQRSLSTPKRLQCALPCKLPHATIVYPSDIPVVHGLSCIPIQRAGRRRDTWSGMRVIYCEQSANLLPAFMLCRDSKCTHTFTYPGCWVGRVYGEAQWVHFDNCRGPRPTHARPPFDHRVHNYFRDHLCYVSWIDSAGIDSSEILGQSAISSPEALRLRHYLACNVIGGYSLFVPGLGAWDLEKHSGVDSDGEESDWYDEFGPYTDTFSEFGTRSPLFVCNACAGPPMTQRQFLNHVKTADHKERCSLITTLEDWKVSELKAVTATKLWMDACLSVALCRDMQEFWNFRNSRAKNLGRDCVTEGFHDGQNPLEVLVVEVAYSLLQQLDQEEGQKGDEKEHKPKEKQEKKKEDNTIMDLSLWTTEKQAEVALQIFQAPQPKGRTFLEASIWLSCGSISLAEMKSGRAKEKHDLMDGFVPWDNLEERDMRYYSDLPPSNGKFDRRQTKQMFVETMVDKYDPVYDSYDQLNIKLRGYPEMVLMEKKYPGQFGNIMKMVIVDAMAMAKAIEVEAAKYPLTGGKYPRVYPPGFGANFFWLDGCSGWGKPHWTREGGLWEWEKGGGGGMGGRISWEMGGAAMATSPPGISLDKFDKLGPQSKYCSRLLEHSFETCALNGFQECALHWSAFVLDICHGKKMSLQKHSMGLKYTTCAPSGSSYFDYARHDNGTRKNKRTTSAMAAEQPYHCPITISQTNCKLVQQVDISSGKVRPPHILFVCLNHFATSTGVANLWLSVRSSAGYASSCIGHLKLSCGDSIFYFLCSCCPAFLSCQSLLFFCPLHLSPKRQLCWL